MQFIDEATFLYGSPGSTVAAQRVRPRYRYRGQTTWLCDVYSDRGALIADFHDEGLVVIDGRALCAGVSRAS